MKRESDAKVWCLLLSATVILMFLCGCTRTVYVPTTEVKTETAYIEKYVRDSIYMSDTVRIVLRGDTTYIETTRYSTKIKYVCDTAYVYRVDSIPYSVEVVRTKEVIPAWCWWSLAIAGVAIGCAAWLLLNKIKG